MKYLTVVKAVTGSINAKQHENTPDTTTSCTVYSNRRTRSRRLVGTSDRNALSSSQRRRGRFVLYGMTLCKHLTSDRCLSSEDISLSVTYKRARSEACVMLDNRCRSDAHLTLRTNRGEKVDSITSVIHIEHATGL